MRIKRETPGLRDVEAELTALFHKLQTRFRPVMRHYFTECHKSPMSWFRMRLNYARSVATTSIVGHIIGLGDRHLSNILMDNENGEVVHIDLGIAFEQVGTNPHPFIPP
jgi:serine-protein kinase ATM